MHTHAPLHTKQVYDCTGRKASRTAVISYVQKLKDLYTKRDEAKRKALLDAIEKSNRSYEEIMAFLTAE